MPNINDIVTIAEALEKSPVLVVPDKCVSVRNRNATCRKCVNACQANAIDVSGNELTLDAASCMACGACVTVCPTEALIAVSPSDAELVNKGAASIQENGGTAVFACARAASKRTADPSAYVEVPCLPRVDEGTVLVMAANGAQKVCFVDGNCSTCKYGVSDACIRATLDYSRTLLEAQGCATELSRMTGFPQEMLVDQAQELHGTTRRGFFSEAIGAARETTMTAAQVTIAQELGYDSSTPAIGERLRVTSDGTLPLVQTRRHDALINALYELGEPQVDVLESRVFGAVDIDASKCNACGMCAVFCPTGALRRDPAMKPGDPVRYLEFSASSCVQCGLCADVCWKRALTLNTAVEMAQLFDFEPVSFDLAGAARQPKRLF